MSGGTFDYKEYNIESIANEIREIYLKHKCKEWIKWMRSKEFYADFKPYPKKNLGHLQKSIQDAQDGPYLRQKNRLFRGGR